MFKKLTSFALAAVLALSLAACGSGGSGSFGGSKEPEQEPVDLAAFVQILLENHEFSHFLQRMDPEDEKVGAVFLENYLPGLTDLDLEQMEVYLCVVSFNSGEFTLVQAKSADDAEAVRGIFQARIDSMTEEGMNYPETVELWSNNAQVVVNGTYVMLVCHEDCTAIVEEFNALFK